MSRLSYGDNLHVLRDTSAFPDACVDLIYLAPPFNSKRDYCRVVFKIALLWNSKTALFTGAWGGW